MVTEIDEQYQKWQPYTSKTVIFHAGNRNKEKLRILLSLEKMNQPVWSRWRGGVEQGCSGRRWSPPALGRRGTRPVEPSALGRAVELGCGFGDVGDVGMVAWASE
jgi:hypothetical protein